MIRSPTLIPTAEVTGIWLDPAGTRVLVEVIMVVVVVVVYFLKMSLSLNLGVLDAFTTTGTMDHALVVVVTVVA